MHTENYGSQDLNFIIETFDDLQKSVSELQEEKASLEETIKKYKTEESELTQSLISRDKELESLQNVITDLHQRMSHHLDLADKTKVLQIECDKKDAHITLLQKELNENRAQHESDMLSQKEEMKRLVQQAIRHTTEIENKQQEDLELLIATHEATMTHLQQNIIEITKTKDAELLKTTIEYETKISKLQMQKIHTAAPQVSSTTQEIFRQKQQHMKAEYDHKVKTLQQSNDELSRRIGQLERADISKLSLSSSKKRRF